jgi:transposase
MLRRSWRLSTRNQTTLAEIAAHLQQLYGCAVAPSSVWRLLDRHGLSFKKRRTPPGSGEPTSGRGGWAGSRCNPT